MQDQILNLFSKYELKARIFPALLAIAPFGLTILIWYPELINLESSAITLLVLVIILFSLAKVAREKGKKKQNALLKKWGGFPSTTLLKHDDNTINENTKQRYHNYLNKNVPGIQLPSKEEELNDSSSTNSTYESAVHWLLEKTRDTKKFPLLYEDNINYGFSRNMLGIKPIGIIFTFVSLGINILGVYQQYAFTLNDLPLKIWISLIITIFFILLWVFFVKEEWVKSASYAYARTLLSTCEDK
ncbi:hypothetical protein [Pontibacillus salipaludis]|uniref:hypothetical protein n=1 Tax=Pontibacillus salipaludis TaxID=1697394 RepID=UPI0031E91403